MKPFLVLLLLAGNLQAATIYQCTSPTGRAIFSDQPCGDNAKRQELSAPPLMHSDMEVSAKRQQQLDLDLAAQVHQRRLDRIDNAIAEAQRQLLDARHERDLALERLTYRQRNRAQNDLADILQQRERVKRHYRDQQDRLKRRLAALQKDRREAERY